jgi:hypothetical protein
VSEDVRIPSNAVSTDTDVAKPTQALLQRLQLLGPTEDDGTPKEGADGDGYGSIFTGPPQSVALIEAGATAAAKWWAAGAGGAIVVTWGAVLTWFGDQDTAVQVAVLGAAGIVSAALVLAIGYLLASDVRGRGLAAAATIEARSKVALTMVGAAETLYQRPAAKFEPQLVALPTALEARLKARLSEDEDGWRAIAIERAEDGDLRYIVVKGDEQVSCRPGELVFVSPAPPPTGDGQLVAKTNGDPPHS